METPENAIQIITDALAKMTLRALEAERRLEVAEKDRELWYQQWHAEHEQREELEQKLHQIIEKYQEGAQNNGKCN